MRKYVWLECTECGELNYRVQKGVKPGGGQQDRLQLRKYCPRQRKHTLHRESRKS
jgi:large subunit ribosomal protein L33